MRSRQTDALHVRPRPRFDVSRSRLTIPSVMPYSSFAQVYDFLVGSGALPLIQHAFRRSVSRFALEFGNLADVGCGTGIFLSTFACRPVDLIGVDRSAAVLAIARDRFAGCPVTLLRQDIRDLSPPHPVDLITCQHQTLNYLTITRELARAFSAVARNLRRGGAFLFDILARTPAMLAMQPRRIREAIGLPDHQVDFDAIVDPARGRSTVRIRIEARRGHAGPSLEVHRQRWFEPELVRRLLRAAGFRVCDMRPMKGSNDAWIHVVARRL
jgi:SAM-dependent methyltransferase